MQGGGQCPPLAGNDYRNWHFILGINGLCPFMQGPPGACCGAAPGTTMETYAFRQPKHDDPDYRATYIGFRCSVSPGVFLEGQVRRLYGAALSPRAKFPGLFPVRHFPQCLTKDVRPCPVW